MRLYKTQYEWSIDRELSDDYAYRACNKKHSGRQPP